MAYHTEELEQIHEAETASKKSTSQMPIHNPPPNEVRAASIRDEKRRRVIAATVFDAVPEKATSEDKAPRPPAQHQSKRRAALDNNSRSKAPPEPFPEAGKGETLFSEQSETVAFVAHTLGLLEYGSGYGRSYFGSINTEHVKEVLRDLAKTRLALDLHSLADELASTKESYHEDI